MKVSIIIPVYNEQTHLAQIIDRIKKVSLPIDREIIIVDDGSTDDTSLVLSSISDIKVVQYDNNRGKGFALRTGFAHATGEIILIQDADFEYFPEEYPELLAPLISNEANMVYGSRFIGKKPEHFFFHTYWANKLLSFLTRLVIPLHITDMETCYKAMHRSLISKITLYEHRFGIEPELTIKLSRLPEIRYCEISISYTGRSIKQGKKVRWWDGVWAIWCIFKYGLKRGV